MDQAAWEYSAPFLLNGQQGNDPETISLPPGDLYGFYRSEPIATNDPVQAVDLVYAHPLFPGFVQPHGAGLPLSSAYADSEQSPGAGLPPGLVNHADVLGHVLHPTASLPLSSAYTTSEQSLDTSLLLSPLNYVDVSGPACIGYHTHANELSPLQPQSDHSDTFSTDFSLFNEAILPQDSAYGGWQYPIGYQNFAQSIFWPEHQSKTVHQFGLRHDNNSNHMLSGSKYILGTDLAPTTSSSGSCARCRLQKIKCKKNTSSRESRCSKCTKQGIPPSICSIVITWETPFNKCLDTKYPLRYTSIQSSSFGSSKTVQLGHYPKGPTLTVECCQFRATNIIQTSVLRKNRYGWCSMLTPAWCLKNPIIDISLYLQECVNFSMAKACARQHPQLSPFFKLARIHNDVPTIQLCWKFFTALRLLRLAWDFSGNESLGIETVKDKESVFYGFRPVPRMLRDQLNYALELEMMKLDRKILKDVRRILENGRPNMWVIGYLVLFFLLHVREVYAGRLLYWSHSYSDLADFWIHRSSPTALINNLVASCNSLLSLFHFSTGPKLLHLDWDDHGSKNIVSDSRFVESMKELQTHARKLKTNGLIGQKACDVYEAGNPNSVDLTVCLLIFESTEKGCEVKGFY